MTPADIEKFFVDQLANDARFADIDTSVNSHFHDLVIKPNLLLAKGVLDYVNYTRIGTSLDYFSYMTPAQVDNLAANYFINRHGAKSVFAEITAYFEDSPSANQTFEVRSSDNWTGPNGAIFNTTQDYIFIPSTLPIVQVIPGINYRMAVFPVVSNNAAAKVAVASISSSMTHPALISATNLSPSSDAVPEETNLQLKARMVNGPAARTLVGRSNITATLTETFPFISDVFSIGYGDAEMQRDIGVASKAWSFHAGGMIDTYVRTPLKPTTFQVVGRKLPNQNAYRFYMKRYKGFDMFGSDKSQPHPSLLYGWERVALPDNAYMEGATQLPELPFLFLDTSRTFSGVSIENPGQALAWSDFEIDPSNMNYKVEISSPENFDNYRFSIYEQLQVDLYFTRNIGDIVSLTIPYWTIDSLEKIQNFVSAEATRFQCSDNVVKSFVPVEIIKLVVPFDKQYSFDQTVLAERLAAMINSWILPDPIRLSDILKFVPAPVRLSESGRDFPGTGTNKVDQSYETPPSYFANYNGPTFVETRQHNINGSSIHYYSTREASLIENFPLSASKRTTRYFIEPSRIKFIPSSW